MLITSLDFSTYVGRIAIGRISRGSLKENQPVSLVKRDGTIKKMRVKEVFVFEGFEEFHGSTNKVNGMFLIFLLSTLHPQWKSQILSIRLGCSVKADMVVRVVSISCVPNSTLKQDQMVVMVVAVHILY